MSLRSKILIFLGLLWATLVVSVYFFTHATLIRQFEQVELDQVQHLSKRIQESIASEQEALRLNTVTWAIWDDTYRFMKDRNAAYIQSNLVDASLVAFEMNFVVYFDLKGSIVLKRAYNLEAASQVAFPTALAASLQSDEYIWNLKDYPHGRKGLFWFNGRPHLFASMPILNSENNKPSRGTLLFVREITPLRMQKLEGQTQTPLQFSLIRERSRDEEQLKNTDGVFLRVSPELAKIYLQFRDQISGETIYVSSSFQRAVYQQGLQTIRYLMSILLIVAFIFGGLLWFVLHRFILARITALKRWLQTNRPQTVFFPRLPESFLLPDELGSLGKTMNRAITQLEESFQLMDEKYRETQRLNREIERTKNQLIQSQKYETISQLATGLGAEFNRLVGIVQTVSDLIERDLKDNTEQKKRLNLIQNAAKEASVGLKRLLQFAQRTPDNFKEIRIRYVFLEIQDLLSSALAPSITVRTETSSDVATFKGSHSRISQALINLAMIAKMNMPSGGQLLYQAENVEADEDYCRSQAGLTPGRYVSVRLSFVGAILSEVQQSQMLDPLNLIREENEISMSAVYSVVKNHQGFFTIYSEERLGTVFNLYFPRSVSQSIQLKALQFDESQVSTIESFNGRLMLVADDDYLLRELARELLESEGAVVLTAESGTEALSIFNAHKNQISVVLCDAIMPQLNGTEVLQQIAADCPHTGLILVSGFADLPEQFSMPLGSETLYLQKPYKRQELLEACWSVIRKSELKANAR